MKRESVYDQTGDGGRRRCVRRMMERWMRLCEDDGDGWCACKNLFTSRGEKRRRREGREREEEGVDIGKRREPTGKCRV